MKSGKFIKDAMGGPHQASNHKFIFEPSPRFQMVSSKTSEASDLQLLYKEE